jgi:fluoroacetyl-CoA thioesterase
MVVAAKHTVPEVERDWIGFVDMPPVLATAMMIGFIEQTCIQALRPYLSVDQRTVGTHVDVSHVAATPVGMQVRANVELIEVEGRSLVFRVACFDQGGLIGEGLHRRAIIDATRFMKKVAEKEAEASKGSLA